MGIENSGTTNGEKDYDALLWKRAEELANHRTPLTKRQMELYEEIEALRASRPNLHQRKLIEEKEREYWRLGEKVGEIIAREDEVMSAMEQLSMGIVDSEKLNQLLPAPVDDTPQISRRKQLMREERERLGQSPAETAWDIVNAFGSNPTNVTSGRNLSSFKGNLDAFSAKEEFIARTADTHGGKVSYGKKAHMYTTAEGRKIRKF